MIKRLLVAICLPLGLVAYASPASAQVQGKATGRGFCGGCNQHFSNGWANHKANCPAFAKKGGGGGGSGVPGLGPMDQALGDIITGRVMKDTVLKGVVKVGVFGLLDSLLSSGGGSSGEAARREREARAEEQRRLEAIRIENERLERIAAAAEMREEWDRRDAEMSERLAGVFDVVPTRRSTPFFGIEGNPDDEAVAEALAGDTMEIGRVLFDGAGFRDPLRELESRMRTDWEAEEWRDAPASPTVVRAPSAHLTHLIEGAGLIEPTPVNPTPVVPFLIEPTPVIPTAIRPTPIEPMIVRPTPIRPLMGRTRCQCGGVGCMCIKPGLCGGTQGCACRAFSPHCRCEVRCKFAFGSCCSGNHDHVTRVEGCTARCPCLATCRCR